MISKIQAQAVRDALADTLENYVAPFEALTVEMGDEEPMAKACEAFSDAVRRAAATLTDELLQEEARRRERFGSAAKFFPPLPVVEPKPKKRIKKTEETIPASPIEEEATSLKEQLT